MGRETFIAPLSWEREPFDWKENKDLWPVVSPISGKVEKKMMSFYKFNTDKFL